MWVPNTAFLQSELQLLNSNISHPSLEMEGEVFKGINNKFWNQWELDAKAFFCAIAYICCPYATESAGMYVLAADIH